MTKDELHEVNYITQSLNRERERLAKLVDWIKRITKEIDGLPHDHSYQRSSVEELTTQKVDCENRINELLIQRADKRAELVKAIDSKIADNMQKAILVERYSFGEAFKKIAEKFHMSENNVFVIHRKGLKILLS